MSLKGCSCVNGIELTSSLSLCCFLTAEIEPFRSYSRVFSELLKEVHVAWNEVVNTWNLEKWFVQSTTNYRCA